MDNHLIIIGSRAGGCVDRKISSSTDYDLIGTPLAIGNLSNVLSHKDQSYLVDSSHKVIIQCGMKYDCEIAYLDSSGRDIIEYMISISNSTGLMSIPNTGLYAQVAPTEILWLLKESHKYKDSVHFEKTRNDLIHLRNLVSDFSKVSPVIMNILKKREAETYTRPSVKLNVSKEEFFSNDGVFYKYDHDRLHELISIDPRWPAYLLIKSNGADVLASKKKWDSVDDNIKVNCVIEEAMVIAFERGVAPFNLEGKITTEHADRLFKIALQKICTTLTSGWFREYAWTHYDMILSSYKSKELMNHPDNFCQRLARKSFTFNK